MFLESTTMVGFDQLSAGGQLFLLSIYLYL